MSIDPAGYARFVALGDSITEGLSDDSRQPLGQYLGWADRLAMILAGAPGRTVPLHYANLAVRSRKLRHVLGEQIPEALDLAPDLVALMIGGNDLAGHRADPDAIAADLERAVQRLSAPGRTVLVATCFDPQFAFLKPLRERAGIFNAHVWGIAARHGATVLDVWGIQELNDRQMWAADRVHPNSRGHRLLAYRAAERLGITDAAALSDLETSFHDDEPLLTNRQWLTRHVLPWMVRRMRGRTAGDGLNAKQPLLRPVVHPARATPTRPGRTLDLRA